MCQITKCDISTYLLLLLSKAQDWQRKVLSSAENWWRTSSDIEMHEVWSHDWQPSQRMLASV